MNSQELPLLQRIALSFKYAFEGIAYVIKTQRNAKIHAIVSICVLILGIWLQLSRSDWAAIVLAVMVVWAAEFFNTALEAHVDLTTPERQKAAKIVKDVAAGGVLLASVGAVIVGLLILGPPLYEKIF